MKKLNTLVSYLFEKVSVMEIFILLFGCTAIWLVGRHEPWRRWGYIFGLCSQPFWFIVLYRAKKYAVMGMSVLYSYSWAQGVWFYWIVPLLHK
jgi:nicotinamide riboside transporter PnuC